MKLSTGIFLISSLIGAAVAVPLELAPRGNSSLVQSNQLRRILYRYKLWERAQAYQNFANSTGYRVAGSKGHNLTVDYIYDTLAATGYYNVEKQRFTYVFSEGNTSFYALGTIYRSSYFYYSPSTNGSTLTLPMAKVANLGCDPADFPAAVRGKIALISRGGCRFSIKVANAGATGAAAAIIYNNAPGPIGLATLGEVSSQYVPAAGISGADGASLIDALEKGPVQGSLRVDSVVETRYTNNVIATTKGGNQENIIVAGGHTDSVAAGPGMNDNGSGSIGILEIAVQLSRSNVTNAVRFGFWSAEEFGLLGSEHYIATLPQSERDKIALYINSDMTASPNYGYFIYDGDGSKFNITGPPGSDAIERLFEVYFKEVGLHVEPTAFDGRSDYRPFIDSGIPSGGLFTGAEGIKTVEQQERWGGKAGVPYDVNYHTARDDIKNMNMDAWIQNTKACAHAIATYARSTDSIPKRSPSKRVKRHMNLALPGAPGSKPVAVA